MLEPSSPPSWLRPASVRWVDASQEYHGLATRRAARSSSPGAPSPDWSRVWSDVVYSLRTLEALRDAGCTALTIHFDHGFGLAAQAEELEHAAEFAAVCHDLGLRVFAYVEAGALFYESLMAEHPDLAAWAQRTPQGDPVPAETLVPAWRPCYLSRGFLTHLKTSITRACEQTAVDGVQLANVGPHECYCERCQHIFRRLLGSRHTDPHQTFGLPSFDHVRIPVHRTPSDSLCHEAAYFRTYVLRRALAELRIHLRSLSAHLALWAEPKLGAPDAVPCAALWELCTPADILSCEVPGEAAAATDDPIARIQPYVHALLCGAATRTVVCGAPVSPASGRSCPPSATRVCTESCTAMAFGGHVMANPVALKPLAGATGPLTTPGFLADEDARLAWQRSLDFAARHEHYHHRARSLAEVAIAFSAADVDSRPEVLALLRDVQTALLEACIPFDLLPMEEAGSNQHRVFVVTGDAPVTDQEGDILCAMAREGRALVLVGRAGAHDPLARPRQRSVFAPVMGLPQVRQIRENPPAAGRPEDLRPAVQQAVQELLPRPPAVEVVTADDSRPPLVIAAQRLPTQQATFHLVNLGPAPAEGVRLRVRAELAPGRHVAWHEPDAPDAMLDCVADGATIITALPPLRVYGLVVTS